MISANLKEFSSKYRALTNQKFGYTDASRLITEEIPFELLHRLNLDRQEYKVQGSVGQGSWAEIPWVAIMHRGITETTQNGYYIALLLSSNLEYAYITLGLGWSQFREKYGTKTGLSKIVTDGYILSKKLPLEDDDITEMIDLGAKLELGRGYEAGNICSRKFKISDSQDGDLYLILEQYLEYYWQLIDEVGADIFFDEQDLPLEFEKDVKIKSIETRIRQLSSSREKSVALLELKSLADTLPPKKREYIAKRTIRNRAFADFVKIRASYRCEICGKLPFIKRDGTPYAEADHVAPLFHFGVDHPDNMRCLCAQCHRVITFGSDEEIAKLNLV